MQSFKNQLNDNNKKKKKKSPLSIMHWLSTALSITLM